MESIHSGDPRALQTVLERYWSPLVSYASRLLCDRDQAEDVVQETMVRLWDRRTEWTPSQQLQGFLYRITRNLALNERSKKKVRTEWARTSGSEPRQQMPTPLELAERAELRALLDRVVDELPPRRQEVFVLSRYHGHTYRQIAEIMDISPQTVANQMSAALEELRDKLRPQLAALVREDFQGTARGSDHPS